MFFVVSFEFATRYHVILEFVSQKSTRYHVIIRFKIIKYFKFFIFYTFFIFVSVTFFRMFSIKAIYRLESYSFHCHQGREFFHYIWQIKFCFLEFPSSFLCFLYQIEYFSRILILFMEMESNLIQNLAPLSKYVSTDRILSALIELYSMQITTKDYTTKIHKLRIFSSSKYSYIDIS